MRDIFEGSKEPLFGRATAKIHLQPLGADVLVEILTDNNLDPAKFLLLYYTLFGGVPKYYFLLNRHKLFKKNLQELLIYLFCEPDAILQNEGKELLIEEFGKNYHLYFSILQVIAGGETQMVRIADGAGISVNSISKYLEELVDYYQVIERRLPITSHRNGQKTGRYHISDPLLKFWFRYIHRNQSLIALGDAKRLAEKIQGDLPTFMGWTFETLIRDLFINRNDASLIPFRFERIGGYWNRTGNIELDIVALDERGNNIFFGECKLDGNKFTPADAKKLKEKASQVNWGGKNRHNYYALISNEEIKSSTVKDLMEEDIFLFDVKYILSRL
jgi:AAA+ ATPase superfamily predicted ATPase